MGNASPGETVATPVPSRTADRHTSAATEIDLDEVARLRVAVARLNRRLRQHAETGLSLTQYAAMVTIAEQGPLPLGRLAAVERIAPATVTKIVGQLEAEGLVSRTTDRSDGRVVNVAITDAGRARLEQSRRRRTAWLATQLSAPGAPDPGDVAITVRVLEALAIADTDTRTPASSETRP